MKLRLSIQKITSLNPRQKITIGGLILIFIFGGYLLSRQIFHADVLGTLVNAATLTYTDNKGQSQIVTSNTVQIDIDDSTFTISGHITLLNYSANISQIPITVELKKSDDSLTTKTIYPASNGYYNIPDVVAGSYTIRFKASHWLAALVSGVAVNNNINIGNVTLRNGDANNDNAIDEADLSILSADWYNSPPSNPNADLNGDGGVDEADLSVTSLNWYQSGD